MSIVYSQEKNKQNNYIFIYKFNINNVDIKKDRDSEGKFNNKVIIQYNKNGFYIVPIKCFKSYGIKKVELFGDELSKISIIFEDDNKYHNIYRNVLDQIYNRVNLALKSLNAEAIHPMGEKKYNTIDIQIEKFTKFYEYNNVEAKPITLNFLHNLSNVTFKISPIIYLKKLTIKNNKTYFNFVIKEAYIQFDKPIIPFDILQNMFQSTSIDYDIDEATITENNDYL